MTRLTSAIRTLFDNEKNWQLKDSSDPLEGWPIYDVLKFGAQCGVPKNDVYGSLYWYILSSLQRFCQQVSCMDIHFHMLQYNALDLPSYFETLPIQYRFFDRIEVSNIVDRSYLGLERTLTTLGPWLKPADINPHATLLALFLNAVPESTTELDTIKNAAVARAPVLKFLPGPERSPSSFHPKFIKYMCALELYNDFEGIFQRYMKDVDFKKCGKAAGMKMREKNTIVEPWPLRLDPKDIGEEGKRKFELLLASGHTGYERYVEWVRADPGLGNRNGKAKA